MYQNYSSDYEVCHCHNVTLQTIVDSITKQGATTLGQIQELTKAGTDCRNCMFEEADNSKMKKEIYCKEILNYYKDING